MKKSITVIALAAGLVIAPVAFTHLENAAFNQSYRQSLFALMGANMGPMGSMAKGEVPWDGKRFAQWAKDLDRVAQLDIMRGFPPGSEGGKTRAKPNIWENTEDFEAKIADLRRETAAMAKLSRRGNRKALMKQLHKTGGTCKSCHDEYKSKDYL